VDYLSCKKQFDAEHDSLALPHDCQEIYGPIISYSTLYSWDVEWYLKFSDDKFIRIKEHYRKIAGLQDARRQSFSYHYGPIAGLDSKGLPAWGSEKPVHIRIDNSNRPVHLHLGTAEHILQGRIEKLDLNDLDMFDFVSGIFEHRSSGKAFEKVFGFRIR
jgi:hypothetical protein